MLQYIVNDNEPVEMFVISEKLHLRGQYYVIVIYTLGHKRGLREKKFRFELEYLYFFI